MQDSTDDCALFPVMTLSERHRRASPSMPFRFGIPLPKGRFFEEHTLTLIQGSGVKLPACFEATARWPDNSIQWCLVSSCCGLGHDESLQLGVAGCLSSLKPSPKHSTLIDVTERALDLRTDKRTISIDTKTLGFISSIEENLSSNIILKQNGIESTATIDHYNYAPRRDADGAQSIEINLKGAFQLQDERQLAFQLCLEALVQGGRVDASLTLHNPAAAVHPKGLWDLGDPKSVLFESLEVQIIGEAASTDQIGSLFLNPNEPPQDFHKRMSLTQHSSGGDHWNSPVHVDYRGQIPMRQRGYHLRLDDRERFGDRTDPVAQLHTPKVLISARMTDFWQRFPSKLAVEPGKLTLGLLPNTDEPHELQPGERCTHRFSVYLGDSENGQPLQDPAKIFGEPVIVLQPDYVNSCALPELGDTDLIDPRLQALIKEGLIGSNNFFAKREAIDEYGWRHFGDLWADHETDGYTGDRPFVSHYNNQYDPLFGFIREYLHSGNPRWFELANDLAAHTRDIDIYHTDEDRPEYNHGLFWHTDHYVHAETSSHRSFSKLQPEDAYDDHSHGGGPGGQHCYTTGLLYHYLLTGDASSREALHGLCNWIERVYEGSGTLIEVALAVKNRNHPGLKNRLSGRYPLDRGVANYIQALLDSFTLNRDHRTIQQVGQIIRNTVHPDDNVDQRDLKNVEERWFYTVFLQSLCRYLRTKADINAYDDDFMYARDSLLRYADWMVLNEQPYLSKPDILEFPNQTWNAQDLRKVNVLYTAAYWAHDGNAAYAIKATALLDYVMSALRDEPSRQYTRILSLLMQNQQPTRQSAAPALVRPPRGRYNTPETPGTIRQTLNLARLCWRSLKTLQLKRELIIAKRILAIRSKNE
jgi:hypothetical protein